MAHGRPAVGVLFRLLRGRAPGAAGADAAVHLARRARGAPRLGCALRELRSHDGFVFEGAYRVAGPGWPPGGDWYAGVCAREEAARGLNDSEDVWAAGRFSAEVEPGGPWR